MAEFCWECGASAGQVSTSQRAATRRRGIGPAQVITAEASLVELATTTANAPSRFRVPVVGGPAG